MSALDSLTVAITSFKRAAHLNRAIESCRATGIRNIAIASSEPGDDVMEVIANQSIGWKSYKSTVTKFEVGCNNLWLLAGYLSGTSRVVLLHDDDCLSPEFASTYESVIAPELDRNPATFASWRASLLFEDGSERFTEYFQGPTRTMPSTELNKVVGVKGRLSLSPVISVLDRGTVINACKEAEQTLTHNDCLYHPGMLLGTELIVYGRQIRAFPRWLYVDQILSRYGSHDGSGTVRAQQGKGESWLIRGYDIARLQCKVPPPKLKPKIIFVHCPNPNADSDEITRNRVARESWDMHFGQGDVIELPVRPEDLRRSSADVGDARAVPYVRDLFDAGVAMATPDDVIVYCNQDIVLSTQFVELIVAGVVRGKGATCCQRRKLTPTPGRLYKNFVNCKTDGGFDVFGITPHWWKANRAQMPDMFVASEAFDTCLRVLIEEAADGRGKANKVTNNPAQWNASNAYTDHVAGHQSHMSRWIVERMTNPGNLHNRRLAQAFFMNRGNHDLVAQLTQ